MTVFYFRVLEDETINKCATLLARDDIAETLAVFGFDWLEMQHGQACFESNGNFSLFKKIVEKIVKYGKYNLVTIGDIPDPGYGLFL